MTETNEILKRLRAAGSVVNIAGMARYGIRPAMAYGVATPTIRAIAKGIRRNPELASALWSTGVLEARMLATMIANPLELPEEDVERWVRDFDCWPVCDSLLAGLAVHDKKANDQQFRGALGLIAKAATDDLNFVKKAVNWALRQIGKRNRELREAAIQVAESLIATDSRPARWIGRDALRELRRKDLVRWIN
jgi:3-methyladenine DNA glycosylase AlkD